MSPDAQSRPSGRYERFVARQRQRASEAGRALPRLAVPSVATPALSISERWRTEGEVGFVYVWRRRGAWVWADLTQPDPAPVHRMADQGVAALSTAVLPSRTDPQDPSCQVLVPGMVLVLPDRATARALADHARRGGAHDLSRLITVTASLTSSSRVVVLTEALARKFWLPQEVSETDLTGICHAVGVGARTRLSAIRRLLLTCYRTGQGRAWEVGVGDQGLGTWHDTPVTLHRGTREELRLAMWVGAGAPVQQSAQFAMVSAISAAWDHVTACDPLGREQARIDGTVFDVWLDPSSGDLCARGPMKLRGDRGLVLCPDHPLGDYQGDVVRLSGEQIVMRDGVFRMRPVFGRGTPRDLAEGKVVAATQAPFLTGPPMVPGKRWFAEPGSPEGPPALRRDVPLSVSLSGAPTGP